MQTLKLIACTIILLSSLVEIYIHKEVSDKALLWLILFWVMIK